MPSSLPNAHRWCEYILLANGTYRAATDLAPWHAFQDWLAAGDCRVSIPYASALAELIPPVAVRLRRDFRAVLYLIRSHALLHPPNRGSPSHGAIIRRLLRRYRRS